MKPGKTEKQKETAPGTRRKPNKGLIVSGIVVGGIIVLSAAVFTALAVIPVSALREESAGFTPFRDDEMANTYAPLIAIPPRMDKPEAVYYRAAKDQDGNIYLAYHYVWASETNDGPGIGPLLNRMFYSGGLSLQRFIFGKGDVEVIAVKLAAGKYGDFTIERVWYETPVNYDVSSFSVTHEKVEKVLGDGEIPIFMVASWNHLFSHLNDFTVVMESFPVMYFHETFWNEFEMTKSPVTFLKRDRAHFAWEREPAR